MRILIINPFGIGDVLFSLPLLHALKEALPQSVLGYLSNRRTEEMVSAFPHLDVRLVFEKDEFRAAWRQSKREGALHLYRLVRSVQKQRFDVTLDLSLGWQTGLASRLAGIPERIGFDYRGRGRFLTHRIPIMGFHDRPVWKYDLDLLPLLGIPRPEKIRFELQIPPAANDQVKSALRTLGVAEGDRLVGLVPGGGFSWGPSAVFKQWPPERFADVGDQISTRYGAKVVLFGDAGEDALCRAVAEKMRSRPMVATHIPSLLILAGLLKRCQLLIGNDSGPLHLAACVGTKTISIFGPVDSSVYGPVLRLPTHRVVVKGLACRPCYRSFRFPPCPWENACLRQLPASSVLEVAGELM